MSATLSSPHSDTLRNALETHFGFREFRPLQEEIIREVIGGRDAFVLMPTGGGKSLCFQLPALLLPGLTVVVSPLIALMKDQVDALVENGIAATFINSSLSGAEIASRRTRVLDGQVKLLYLAPERLVGGEFVDFLERIDVSLFAIDEAHCISEWGHDFRSDYRQLRVLRDRFPAVPIIAMTATANQRVQEDILRQLDLGDETRRFVASFDRPNLYYEILPKSGGPEQVLAIVERHRGESGIIYCQSRARAEQLADLLNRNGSRALPYHAGLVNETRASNQEKFVRDDVEIICATIAFGMGIDKPDVRFVIHYDLPKNLMSYYQETGRAGRDGLPSECILLYSPGDRVKIQRFIDEKVDRVERMVALQQLNEMSSYAESGECRRRTILSHFGEEYAAATCDNCDNCTEPDRLETVDVTRHAQMLLSCIVRLREGFGLGHVVDVLRGSTGARILNYRHNLLPTYGIGRDIAKEEWRSVAQALLAQGMIVQNAEEYNVLRLTERGAEFLRSREPLELRRMRPPTKAPSRVAVDLPEEHLGLFERLRALRKRIADEHDVPAYVIFDNRTLIQMAARVPRSDAAFRAVHGIGEAKARTYGSAFLREIEGYVAEHPELTATSRPIQQRERTRRTTPPRSSGTIGETLLLFNDGLAPEEIARQRRLSRNTITTHLEELVAAGSITAIDRLVEADKIASIVSAFESHGGDGLRPVLESLGEGFTYGELRLVRAWLDSAQKS
jgi:ATP-dependent DNA helicase RecQ